MGSIRDMYYGMQNKTLKVGTRFNTDSFQCTDTALGKVTFKWEHPDGENAVYELEMLTDLDIPRITRYTSDLSMSGCLNYNEKDKITGRDIKCKVKFRAEFEYQSDNNFHVVQFKRVPEKSETTSVWVFEWYNEGMMYLNGEGFPKNRDKAIELFRRAANQDHPGAKNMLAKLSPSAEEIYDQGIEAYEAEDYAKAVELFRKSADMGNDNAQNDLGNCYLYGNGVPQDDKKAAEWYRKAADQGHKFAQNNLAMRYYGGEGVPEDKKKAAEWFLKSAEQGNVEAQNNLANCYGNGEGVPQDWKKAAEWFHKAAEQGDANAQNQLGLCYYNGNGVPQDNQKAAEWWRKAVDQGDEQAQDNLDYLKEQGLI